MSFPPVTRIIAPLPLPVSIVPDPHAQVVAWAGSPSGAHVTQQMITDQACKLVVVVGYNADPDASALSFVQLHNAASPISPGASPRVTIPVYGGRTPFSYGLMIDFDHLVIALSRTEFTFTAPADDWLTFQINISYDPLAP